MSIFRGLALLLLMLAVTAVQLPSGSSVGHQAAGFRPGQAAQSSFQRKSQMQTPRQIASQKKTQTMILTPSPINSQIRNQNNSQTANTQQRNRNISAQVKPKDSSNTFAQTVPQRNLQTQKQNNSQRQTSKNNQIKSQRNNQIKFQNISATNSQRQQNKNGQFQNSRQKINQKNSQSLALQSQRKSQLNQGQKRQSNNSQKSVQKTSQNNPQILNQTNKQQSIKRTQGIPPNKSLTQTNQFSRLPPNSQIPILPFYKHVFAKWRQSRNSPLDAKFSTLTSVNKRQSDGNFEFKYRKRDGQQSTLQLSRDQVLVKSENWKVMNLVWKISYDPNQSTEKSTTWEIASQDPVAQDVNNLLRKKYNLNNAVPKQFIVYQINRSKTVSEQSYQIVYEIPNQPSPVRASLQWSYYGFNQDKQSFQIDSFIYDKNNMVSIPNFSNTSLYKNLIEKIGSVSPQLASSNYISFKVGRNSTLGVLSYYPGILQEALKLSNEVFIKLPTNLTSIRVLNDLTKGDKLVYFDINSQVSQKAIAVLQKSQEKPQHLDQYKIHKVAIKTDSDSELPYYHFYLLYTNKLNETKPFILAEAKLVKINKTPQKTSSSNPVFSKPTI